MIPTAFGAGGPRLLAPPVPLQAVVREVTACADAAGLSLLPALGPHMPVALAAEAAQLRARHVTSRSLLE